MSKNEWTNPVCLICGMECTRVEAVPYKDGVAHEGCVGWIEIVASIKKAIGKTSNQEAEGEG